MCRVWLITWGWEHGVQSVQNAAAEVMLNDIWSHESYTREAKVPKHPQILMPIGAISPSLDEHPIRSHRAHRANQIKTIRANHMLKSEKSYLQI